MSSTCQGPSQLSVSHLAAEPFTARDGASQISTDNRDLCLPTCIRRIDAPVRGSQSEYYHNVWYEKTRMMRLPDGEKNFEDTSIRFDRIQKRYGQTDGQTDSAWRHIGCACIASRGKDEIRKTVSDTVVSTTYNICSPYKNYISSAILYWKSYDSRTHTSIMRSIFWASP